MLHFVHNEPESWPLELGTSMSLNDKISECIFVYVRLKNGDTREYPLLDEL